MGHRDLAGTVLFDLLGNFIHAACSAGDCLKDTIIHRRLAQFHFQQKLRLILQERASTENLFLDILGNRPLIAESLQVAENAAQNTVFQEVPCGA